MRQFFLSLVLHALVLCLLLFSLHRAEQPPIVNKGETIIHATAIENTQVKALEKQLEDQKIQQQQVEAERQRQLREKVRRAEEQRVAEQKRIEEEKAIALENKKKEEEKKRLAELEKQKKIEQEKLKKSKEKEEADKLKAQKAIEDAKKAAEEAKKLKEQEQKQYEAAAALQKQIAAKQAAIAQQRAQAINGIVDQYKGLILEAISQHWLVPSGVDSHLASQLIISVNAAGQVQNVQLVKSSGNALLDQSAIAAVYKASPLPMPPDKDAAAIFKQFSLTLRPEQMLDM